MILRKKPFKNIQGKGALSSTEPRLGGSVVSVLGLMTWRLRVWSPVEATFLSGVFSPLTSADSCEKSSRWLWKKSCVSTGVRKPGNTCVTYCHDIWRKTRIQPTNQSSTEIIILATSNLLSANTFSLVQSKILSCGKKLFSCLLTLLIWTGLKCFQLVKG